MECYDGCGAPLVDGKCEHCGREYPDLHVTNLRDIIDVESLFFDKKEEEEEIVAMGTEEEIIKADFGPSYEPGLMEYYPHGFEDTQKTLGLATGAFLLIGALFGFVSPALALPFLGIGLLAAITGGIRQWRHKEEE